METRLKHGVLCFIFFSPATTSGIIIQSARLSFTLEELMIPFISSFIKFFIYTVFHKKCGSTFVIITLENFDGF